MSKPKFEDCVGCRFFRQRSATSNPICGECDHGEFFEPKARRSEPTNDELMTIFGRMHSDE